MAAKKHKKKPVPKKKKATKRHKKATTCPPGLYSVHIFNNGGATDVTPKGAVHVKKASKDEVKWHAKDDFTVTFDKPEGSPFAATQFSGGKGKPAYSDDVVTNLNQDFRYTVQIAGATPLDPIIHTDP